MIFIWGSYARNVVFHELATCTRCNCEREIEFVRTWRTGHFFFFPLFSYNEAVLSRCEHCRREGIASPTRAPVSLPFLDRLGWLFPVGALTAVFLLVMIFLLSGSPPPPRASGPRSTSTAEVDGDHGRGTTIRRGLDANLSSGDNAVMPDEQAIAKAVRGTLEASYKDGGAIRVAARIARAGTPKKVIVLVYMRNLRQAEDTSRARMLEDLRRALA